MDVEQNVPMYKVVLMIGASIAVSVGVTWALISHHESRPHHGAVTREEIRAHFADQEEWQRQQTELIKELIRLRYGFNTTDEVD